MKEGNKKYLLIIAVVIIILSIYFIEKDRVKVRINQLQNDIDIMDDNERVNAKQTLYPRAKELTGIKGYINVDRINISENIGKKVILIDFWTYSCINCQRTLPFLNSWWEKYKDDGLLIIGIHTPEFDFEKDYLNVVKAVEKYNVKYPVVQDNNYETWAAYNNRYWPRKYLIDIDGFIVYDHIGEGSYEETEKKIQELLEERSTILKLNEIVDKSISNPGIDDINYGLIRTNEVYFGLLFSRKQFGNEEGWLADRVIDYKMPANLENGKFYLEGRWKSNKDNMELIDDNGRIKLKYIAESVNLVAGSNNNVEIIVYVDGKEHKRLNIKDFDLYNVADLGYGQHELEIKINNPGLMAYTFTFG